MKVLKELLGQKNAMFKIALLISIFWIILIFVGQFVSPYDPIVQNLEERFLPPSAAHLFGTDSFGPKYY